MSIINDDMDHKEFMRLFEPLFTEFQETIIKHSQRRKQEVGHSLESKVILEALSGIVGASILACSIDKDSESLADYFDEMVRKNMKQMKEDD